MTSTRAARAAGSIEATTATASSNKADTATGMAPAKFGASLLEGSAGREAAEELSHAMNAAGNHSCGEMVRAGDHVGDYFRILGIWNTRFEYADDGGKSIADAAKAKGLANHGRILVKTGRPLCSRWLVGSQTPFQRRG